MENDEKFYATEEQYAEQAKRIKAQRPLSEYEKEEIFFVRWLTFIVSTIIILFIWIVFFNLNGFIAFAIIVLNIFIPLLYFFRKSIGGYMKEKISHWWIRLNGGIP